MDKQEAGAQGALVHISKVAERLGLSEYQTKSLVEKGDLPATKVGRRTYVLTSSIDEYLDRIGQAS